MTTLGIAAALAASVAGVSLQERWAIEAPGAEIVDYDARLARMVVAAGDSILAFDVTARAATEAWRLDAGEASGLGDGAEVTHVAVDPTGSGAGAATIKPADQVTRPGRLLILDLAAGRATRSIETGFGPDAVAFTGDGAGLIVANEGEPALDGSRLSDPIGGVTIARLDWTHGVVSRDIALWTHEPGLRVHPAISNFVADLEPESIAVLGDRAFVALQENNAIAVVDLARESHARTLALGAVDRVIDPSDRDGRRGPYASVKALPMPDQLRAFERDGRVYLVTADEGDDRGDWGKTPLGDVARLGALREAGRLAPALAERLDREPGLERLEVCAFTGDTNRDGLIDEPHILGARSVSVWDAETGRLVGDTGSQLEELMALAGEQYNATGETPLRPDRRSDNRGPEPEGLALGEIDGRLLAFVGLERPGVIAVIDLADLATPRVIATHHGAASGRFAVEGLRFVPAEDSPLSRPMLLAAYEKSGTVVAYEILP
jgi:hypothetical protein